LPAMAALVAVTFRDDELDPAELAGIGGAAEWLTLTGLPEDEVAPVLAAALGREPSADEVRSVHRQTGGNPLFVTQVGRLLAAGAPATVPTGVREVLARRLARLSVACDRVLAVAAVVGTTFDVDVLVEVTGEPHDGVVAALDEAARARVAQPVESRPDRWSFVHDLVRAARYEALGAGERADLHRRVLDVLEARGHSDAGLLAHHAARARFEPGDVRPAALAVGAAQEALARRHRVVALMERRDLHGVDAEVAAFARRSERLGDPLYTWYAPIWRAMRAHDDGRLDEAEALSRQALAIGEAGGRVYAPLLDRVLAICIAGMRGNDLPVVAPCGALVPFLPDLLRLPLRHVLTAWVETEAGRLDGARRALAALDPADLDELPRDQEWLATLAELVMAASAVGDEALLAAAYRELLPHAGLGCFEGQAAVDHGVVDRFLALAGGYVADLPTLERHVAAALAGGEASGAL